MSSSTSAVFTGSSTYSADFAQVITRAQQIASLPISLLTTQKTGLTAEQTAMNGLSGAFSSLQASVISLGSSVDSGKTAVSYSNTAVVSATATTDALLGTYNIEVVDAGSQASATSAAGGAATITDPTRTSLSSAVSYTLTANGQTYSNITPAVNTLSSLADAINAATNGAAQATIVNLGPATAPSYQLSIRNTKYGGLPITLDDGQGGGNLLGTPTAATSVQYRLNGQPAGTPISSDSRSLTIAPNVSLTVLAAGTTNITVAHSTTTMASALNGFVTAYNAANKALDGQRGSSGGALAGQSVVSSLSQSLRDLAGYSSTGSIASIVDLGLEFDKYGVLSFNPSVLSAAAAKDFEGVTAFLGSPASGGFLQRATNTLNGITDSTSGVIPTALLSIAGEITDTGNQIADNQARVDQLTQSLNAQMAAADALVAAMQQQATYFINMFAAMSANQSAMR